MALYTRSDRKTALKRAWRALVGVGSVNVSEELGELSVIVRRFATDEEAAFVGGVLDVRGSPTYEPLLAGATW